MNNLNIIIEYANRINEIDKNPYLKTLKNNPSLESFFNSQRGFINAVDNWSKMLGLLINIVPSDKERLIIIRNLNDEHGHGDILKSHVNTFRIFMNSLGFRGELELNTPSTSYDYVKNFNIGLQKELKTKNWIYCASMLGIIELIYVNVSKHIHDYSLTYLELDSITHYGVHEIVDIEHARELFSMVSPYLDSNRDMIYEGLVHGYKLINILYFDLHTLL
jgi:hypothetical protein